MKLNYNLSEQDLLTFQLYTASNSSYIRRARRINWLVVPILYFVFSVVLYLADSLNFSIGFMLLAILWLIFYPLFQKNRYEKGYKRHNIEYFKNRFDKPIELSFTKEYIASKDESGEGKMKLSELEALHEIQDYYFLKFNSGVSLIIPKKEVAELDKLKKLLENLAEKLGIEYKINLEWKWS